MPPGYEDTSGSTDNSLSLKRPIPEDPEDENLNVGAESVLLTSPEELNDNAQNN